MAMAAFSPLLFIVTAAALLNVALSGVHKKPFQGSTHEFQVAHKNSTHNFQVIRNFQTNKNSTHITFSWDIVDGYYNSSYITNFQIYYRDRAGDTGSSGPIYYSDSYLNGSSFQYTTTVFSFGNHGQYVMWVGVYMSSLSPSYFYSDQIYVEVGRDIAIEVSIQLLPTQTCLAFTTQSTNSYSAVQNEVYWGIQKYCQCDYDYFLYIHLNNGYFTCAAGGYVTFRARLYSTSVTADPADLKSALTNWLHGQDTDKTITLYGMQYSVEPGPCGVTVPHLNAPLCSTPDATTVNAAAYDPGKHEIDKDTSGPILGITTGVTFGGMTILFILTLGLIGYILATRRWRRRQDRN